MLKLHITVTIEELTEDEIQATTYQELVGKISLMTGLDGNFIKFHLNPIGQSKLVSIEEFSFFFERGKNVSKLEHTIQLWVNRCIDDLKKITDIQQALQIYYISPDGSYPKRAALEKICDFLIALK